MNLNLNLLHMDIFKFTVEIFKRIYIDHTFPLNFEAKYRSKV